MLQFNAISVPAAGRQLAELRTEMIEARTKQAQAYANLAWIAIAMSEQLLLGLCHLLITAFTYLATSQLQKRLLDAEPNVHPMATSVRRYLWGSLAVRLLSASAMICAYVFLVPLSVSWLPLVLQIGFLGSDIVSDFRFTTAWVQRQGQLQMSRELEQIFVLVGGNRPPRADHPEPIFERIPAAADEVILELPQPGHCAAPSSAVVSLSDLPCALDRVDASSYWRMLWDSNPVEAPQPQRLVVGVRERDGGLECILPWWVVQEGGVCKVNAALIDQLDDPNSLAHRALEGANTYLVNENCIDPITYCPYMDPVYPGGCPINPGDCFTPVEWTVCQRIKQDAREREPLHPFNRQPFKEEHEWSVAFEVHDTIRSCLQEKIEEEEPSNPVLASLALPPPVHACCIPLETGSAIVLLAPKEQDRADLSESIQTLLRQYGTTPICRDNRDILPWWLTRSEEGLLELALNRLDYAQSARSELVQAPELPSFCLEGEEPRLCFFPMRNRSAPDQAAIEAACLPESNLCDGWEPDWEAHQMIALALDTHIEQRRREQNVELQRVS